SGCGSWSRLRLSVDFLSGSCMPASSAPSMACVLSAICPTSYGAAPSPSGLSIAGYQRRRTRSARRKGGDYRGVARGPQALAPCRWCLVSPLCSDVMTAERATGLIDEFSAFLAGVKVAETLSSDLRSAITVETGLERALQTAVAARRDVIVAGSAGGG